MTINADDPKLTAYVLGELDENERAEVEAHIAESPELGRVVDEIRRTSELITEELRNEPTIGLTADQRQTVEAKVAKLNGATATAPRSFVARFWVPTAIAASFVAAVGVGYVSLTRLSRARDETRLASEADMSLPTGSSADTGWYMSDSNEQIANAEAARLRESGPLPQEAQGRAGGRGGQQLASSRPLRFTPGVVSPGVKDASIDPAYRMMVKEGDVTVKQYIARANDGLSENEYRSGERLHAWSMTGGAAVGGGGGGGGQSVFQSAGGSAGRKMSEATRDRWVRKLQSEGHEELAMRPMKAETGSVHGVGGYQPASDMDDAIIDFRSLPTITFGYEVPFSSEGPACESYAPIVENPFLLVEANPLSTFSIDVDTASYANVRRMLSYGRLPPPDAVRIEELINYFDYDYPQPTGGDPFSVNIEIADCPWNTDHRLARIGIKGLELTPDERPPANLVFLIDVSGSMQSVHKLPLLKEAMTMLVEELWPGDSVAIVVYAGASGLVLPATMCDDKGTILSALENLQAGGSTNGGAGIQLAYDTAVDEFLEGGVNRVILATDGDFNVGTTSRGDLHRLIEEKAKSGVFLSVLGFGMGNLNDATLETLADKGNGNYAYIDTSNEARKVLVDQLAGTLVTIAKDVKIQVEFNPLEAAAYRLIGYENRMLAARDFNDDTKDAGEIGAGHTVTALYEIVPVGVPVDLPDVDPLKYQTSTEVAPEADSGELMTVKLRYKDPDGDTSELIELPVVDTGATFVECSDDFAFAASVASFGMLLRGSEYAGEFTFEAVAETAGGAVGDDPFGYRAEFVELVERAISLQPVPE